MQTKPTVRDRIIEEAKRLDRLAREFEHDPDATGILDEDIEQVEHDLLRSVGFLSANSVGGR